MFGLNTLLKRAQRHQADDKFSIDLRANQFSQFRGLKSRKLSPGGQRSDGYPLYRGDFGDTAGRAIDGLALAEHECQRLHELGLSIL